MDSLRNLFNEIGAVTSENDIAFAKRLGPRGESTRPLLIGFSNLNARESVLDNAKKLAGMDEARQQISIIRDLTPKQREEEENLRKEAVKKNAELSPEDSENWEFRVVGPRGKRRMVRAKKDDTRGRGGRRGGGRVNQ